MTSIKQSWLHTCVASFTAASFLLAPGCTGFSGGTDRVESQELRLSEATDDELFRSVMFGDGKFVKLFPLLESEKGLTERFRDPKVQADVRKVVDLVIDRTAKHSPATMPGLASAVLHGDHEDVRIAMERANTVLRGEVEEIVRLSNRTGDGCVDAECLPPEPGSEGQGPLVPNDPCVLAECLPPEPGQGPGDLKPVTGGGACPPEAECLPDFPTCNVSQCSDAQIAAGTCPCLNGVGLNEGGPGGQALIVGPAVVAVAVAAVAVFIWLHATVGESDQENVVLSERIVDEIVTTRMSQGL